MVSWKVTVVLVAVIVQCFYAASVLGICSSGQTGTSSCVLMAPPSCTPFVPNKTRSYNPPTLLDASSGFTSNTLRMSVVSPYVFSRGFTSVTLTGQTSAVCGFANAQNTFWTKGFNNATCNDVFSFNMPWVNKTLCGFTLFNTDNANSLVTYKGQVLFEYTESVGNFSVAGTMRSTLHSFDIYVQFPTTLTVSISNISVASNTNFDVALTAERYDRATGFLTIELTTAVVYSNMLHPSAAGISSTLVLPEFIALVGSPAVDSAVCGNTAGSVCIQKFTFQLQVSNSNATCNFGGFYSFNTSMVQCRDNGGVNACQQSPVYIGFTLYSDSVCASVGVNPTVTGTLTAYTSGTTAAGTVATSFNLGSQVFFKITTDAGTGNTITVTFTDIIFNDGTADTYLYQTNAVQAPGTLAALAVNNNNGTFSLFLTGSTFRIPLGSTQSYLFKANCQVVFAGNKKRNIELRWGNEEEESRTDKFHASTRINLLQDAMAEDVYYDEEEVVEEEGMALTDVVGFVVGIAVIAGVITTLVVDLAKRRNQPVYTPVNTVA